MPKIQDKIDNLKEELQKDYSYLELKLQHAEDSEQRCLIRNQEVVFGYFVKIIDILESIKNALWNYRK